ncbi:hypothetical protein [Mycetocola spongiae]|uniref:hypothetical protein n=1 Tax=Mycetocola spongiae TaxID=2859226 RepID=UPI001CF42F64|nr:hypothetical protein [Mycetocola spongiae]UCR89320.1 hypothetical protein KXZ72_01005 [Mycetocola spongiae]
MSTEAAPSLPEPVRSPGNGIFGIIAAIIGILVGAWMTAGRVLFGIDGSLILWFALSLAPVVLVIQVLTGRNIRRTSLRGYRMRPATLATLISSWVLGILFGLMVPEATAEGLHSILGLLAGPVAQEIGIGVCNPLGVISVGISIFSLVLSAGDARGPRPAPTEEDPGAEEYIPYFSPAARENRP